MAERQIVITENDEKRLRSLIRKARLGSAAKRSIAEKLDAALRHSAVLRSSRIPEDIVTINSCVRLRYDSSGREEEVWLRFNPEESADPERCEVLSELGVVLLGAKEGDEIVWADPTGTHKGRITEIVYQPERLGNYSF